MATPPLILCHVVTGLLGIACGGVAVVGIYLRKRMPIWNALFLISTAAACATGFVFLPSGGVTSAQLVAFFVVSLLLAAAYARYVGRLDGSWRPVYAFVAVGASFLNVLITTAQSFIHVHALKALAPTQHSPVYVAVKTALLLLFIFAAIFTARHASSRSKNDFR